MSDGCVECGKYSGGSNLCRDCVKEALRKTRVENIKKVLHRKEADSSSEVLRNTLFDQGSERGEDLHGERASREEDPEATQFESAEEFEEKV